jgi:monoamine oxidase
VLRRRSFLSGALAASAIPAVAPTTARLASAASTRAPRIAIVGAGIAGLSAALVLRDRGLRATVYEGQHRIGGRMHSEAEFWGNGQVSEYGGELIDTDHTTIQALAKRYGLTLTDVLAGVPKDAQQTIYQRGAYYPEKKLFQDFRPVYVTLQKQLAAAGYVTTYDRSTAAGRELDVMSLTEWVERFVPSVETSACRARSQPTSARNTFSSDIASRASRAAPTAASRSRSRRRTARSSTWSTRRLSPSPSPCCAAST